MKKLSIEICLPILTLVIFIAFMVCFRVWADTIVYTAPLCRHLNHTTAILANKTPIGGCYWKVGDNRRVSEYWFNCGDFITMEGIKNNIGGKNYNIGDIISFDEVDYSCD